MPTFGFSAFLKLVSQNARPQRTAIRSRMTASQSGGYDFHRSLKLLSHDYLVGELSLDQVLLRAEAISRTPERESAKSGIERLASWRAANPGSIFALQPVLFESPAKNFKVQYLPNFGIDLEGRKTAVHIWNTANPELDARMTYAALSLFPNIYAAEDRCPDDLSVLSLPQSRLYRLTDVEDYSEVGARLVRRLDDLFEEIRHEPRRPSGTPRGRSIVPPPAK